MLRVINVSETIDRLPLGRLQYLVYVLCGATLFVEGFATQAISYVAPALSQEWGLAVSALGPVFSTGLLGLMIGSFLIAPLGDKVGSRLIILLSILIFGVTTLLTPLVHSLTMLLVMRLITGIGLGGAMANAISLTADYAPERARTSTVITVFIGFPLGSAVGGILAAWLIGSHGWQSVFVFGGIIALGLDVILIFHLPDSARFLALRRPDDPALPGLMRRLTGQVEAFADTRFSAGEHEPKPSPTRLFTEGRAVVTLLLWIVFFASLLDLYLLMSWLPTIIHARGISIATAVVATSLLQIGGMLGALTLGTLVRRFGSFRVMPPAFIIGAFCIASIAFVGTDVILTMVSVFCAGFTVIGCQNCINGLASALYPPGLRATGVGFASAVGRIGSVIGPGVAGIMLSLDPSARSVFLFGGIFALCAAMALAMIGRQGAGAVLAAPMPRSARLKVDQQP